MGWANCGTDDNGRPIGYAHDATCDEPGCTEKIHRGLAYACGGMHGEDVDYCDGYFCYAHLFLADLESGAKFVCAKCEALAETEEAE